MKPRRPQSRRGFTRQPRLEREKKSENLGGETEELSGGGGPAVMADFGQTDLGQSWPEFVLQCFDRLSPNRLWPNLFFQCLGQIFSTHKTQKQNPEDLKTYT